MRSRKRRVGKRPVVTDPKKIRAVNEYLDQLERTNPDEVLRERIEDMRLQYPLPA